ncbi:MAG: c-type cytochrome [Chloroflexota bacterium]|nr:c-type cytochrome [Chloroflexota bacterium]
MTDSQSGSQKKQKQRILFIAILALAGFALLLALVISATSSSGAPAADSDAYAARLESALVGADAKIGEALITETDCATCHLAGDGSAAPLFDGLGSLAGQRRPALSAEQYLYEAILYPAAHLLDGYANAMPNNYGERFSPSQIGHMIAYLLTLDAQ